MQENLKKENKTEKKKLDTKKLKLIKEVSIRHDVQAGGCGYCGGCSNWC